MKKTFLVFCLQFILGYCFNELCADNTLDRFPVNNKKVDLQIDSALCTKDVLMTFFPGPIVKAVLVRYGVEPGKAEKIAEELSGKDREVVSDVEKKSAEYDPNPLNDLNQRDLAVKIFRETLYEVFAKVLKTNQVAGDDNEIQTILDDMKEIKGKLFVECIKKEQMPAPAAIQPQAQLLPN